MLKYTLTVLIAVLALSSCKRNFVEGHGQIITENRTIANCTQIEIEAPLNADITIAAGQQPTLQINGFANLLKYIKTEVNGNKLKIFVPGSIEFENDKDIKATISLPALTDLTLTGSPDAHIHNTLQGNSFLLDMTGSSDVTIDNLMLNQFTVKIAGSGSVKVLSGNAERADYDITGAGDIKNIGLLTKQTKVQISGSGDARVNASDNLKVNIAGSGSVTYTGHPHVAQNISGSGSIQQADSAKLKQLSSNDEEDDDDNY